MTSKVEFNNGYFMAPNELFDLNITIYEKMVYIYICRCGNNSTAFPSYNTIAKKSGMSRSKAIDVVSSLQKMELIKKYSRKNEHDESQTNIYEIVPPGVQHASPGVRQTPPSIQDTPYKELSNKKINKNYKGAEFNSTPHFSFNEYLIEYNPDEDVIECVEYYLSLYKEYRGFEHPRLKKEQWDDIFCNLFDVDVFDLSETNVMDMIDQHFKTLYKNCDYNILHFMSENIRINRMYEVAY